LLVIIVLVLILLYITPNKRIDKSKKMTDIQLYKIELHKLTPEIAPEQMTRSEASRYTDRILAEYGRL